MEGVLFPRAHNVADNYLVRNGQGRDEPVQMPGGAGIGEGLKNGPNLLIAHPLGRIERRADFGGMVGVVVRNGYARLRAQKFKPPSGAVEALQPFHNLRRLAPHKVAAAAAARELETL